MDFNDGKYYKNFRYLWQLNGYSLFEFVECLQQNKKKYI